MDGLKKRLNSSIRLQLSFFLSLAIFVVAIAAGVFSFLSAFDEAHELQDDTLRHVAALVDRQHLRLATPGEDARAKVSNGVPEADEESRVIVQYLRGVGPDAAASDATLRLTLPTTLADGLQTLDVGSESFRVLVKTTAQGDKIAVAQATAVRDEIARNSALRTLMPFLILVPVLLLIMADLLRKMFRPITALALEIDQRSDQALHPVRDSHLPIEVRPFVVAINRLLARVAQSMEAQRRFVADAAHELRSPLTAMSLQAERLADTEMSDRARDRLASLRRGIDRGRNLLDQLLTLAKVQTTPDELRAPVSVLSVYRRVLEDLLPLAEAKNIDMGVEGEQDAQVWVSELDLMAVVKNLVDNAIRYTPAGGRVDLSLARAQARVVLTIQDNGAGIALGERDRVFDAFYRTLGSEQVGAGLGLSIVKAVLDRIGADIVLSFSDEAAASGLCVRVLIDQADHRC